MSELLNQIRQGVLAARKERNAAKAAFLSTLLAEAAKVGKDDGNRESTDVEVTAVIKKFLKNIEETLQAAGGTSLPVANLLEERAVLESLLPTQATEEQIRVAVLRLVGALAERNPKQMGVVMGQLNAEFGGNFDKGFASKLVKEALAH